MAWNDLMIKIGMDSKGFSDGTQRIKRDVQGLQQGTLGLSRTITDQRQKLRELWQTQGGNSKQYKALAQDIRANERALRDMNRELMNTQRAQGKSKGGGMFADMKGAVIGGLIGGGAAGVAMQGMQMLKQVTAETIKLQIDFDDSMRKVAATSGANAEQFAKLKNAAIQMGAATKFTGSQAAEALNYMALAGWNAEQSIAGLKGVLDLAAAAGTDLAMTSDIVTDTMAAFGMEASESGKAADIFAKAQSTTNTTVEQLGEAMKYASANAASSNQSLKDTATIMGLLANQGIKGSMAGTSFNAMLKDLKKEAVDGAVSLNGVSVRLYDAEGNFRSVVDIIRDMRGALQGLTTQQRDAITGGIFEERSIRAVNVLLNTTEEDLNKVTTAMDNFNGTAERMANTMEGGLGGATRRLNSAWESLRLNMGGSQWLLGTVNGLTDLVNWLNRSTAAATPLANAMERERIEASALINTIKTLNLDNEHRAGLIAEVNEKYSDYLPSLLSEKASIEELTGAYESLNKSFKERTAAMAQKEQLEGIVTETVRLQRANIDLRKRYEELTQAGFVFSRETRLADILRDIELNDMAISDLSKQYERLSVNAKEAAKSMGLQANAASGVPFMRPGQAGPAGGGAVPGRALEAGEGGERTGGAGAPPPRTIAAIKEHIKALQEQRESVKINSKEFNTLGAEIKRYEAMITENKSSTKSAAQMYKDLQGELTKTAQLYKFMGKESELAAEQSKTLLRAVEAIYKAGGSGAEEYASKVLEQYKRVQDMIPVDGIQQKRVTPGRPATLPGMGDSEDFNRSVLAASEAKRILGELGRELALISKESEAFGMQYDTLGAKIQAQSQAIRDAIESGVEQDVLDGLIEKYRALYDEKERQVEQANRLMAISSELSNAVGQGFENMASGAMTAGEALRSVAASMIQVLLKEAAANMFAAAAKQANAASGLGPLGIPVAGAAIAAMMGLVKGAMSKTKSVALAKGGVVSGETMALVGDNPNAKFDPEVVAPLSKLKGMLAPDMQTAGLASVMSAGFESIATSIEANMGGVAVHGTFEIAGDKLVTVIDNAQRKMKAFRV